MIGERLYTAAEFWQLATDSSLKAQAFGPDDWLEGGAVLPGLRLKLSDLFANT